MDGMSFELFAKHINSAANIVTWQVHHQDEALHRNLRAAIAGELHTKLVNAIVKRLPHLNTWRADRNLIYTEAEAADFSCAVAQFNDEFIAHCQRSVADPIAWWQDIPIMRYRSGLHVECDDWHFPIISVKGYSATGESWCIALTDFGMRLLTGDTRTPHRRNAPIVYVRSEASIDRSLRRMANAFFDLGLEA